MAPSAGRQCTLGARQARRFSRWQPVQHRLAFCIRQPGGREPARQARAGRSPGSPRQPPHLCGHPGRALKLLHSRVWLLELLLLLLQGGQQLGLLRRAEGGVLFDGGRLGGRLPCSWHPRDDRQQREGAAPQRPVGLPAALEDVGVEPARRTQHRMGMHAQAGAQGRAGCGLSCASDHPSSVPSEALVPVLWQR